MRLVNLRRFLALRLLLESNLFKKSATTLNATIAWLENGVSQRLVYTSDIYASKTGTTEFSEIVNNKSKAETWEEGTHLFFS